MKTQFTNAGRLEGELRTYQRKKEMGPNTTRGTKGTLLSETTMVGGVPISLGCGTVGGPAVRCGKKNLEKTDRGGGRTALSIRERRWWRLNKRIHNNNEGER